ncbi:hypothetical protein HDU82_007618 [Entophlyctis luteolus]|nr:hypothetical protein HDU82_007618 [Entophlyctis luteolus]KAJ3389618.1 hypothetical protein HDU84_008539 [Entophlyctis sp. JEL0112]
MNPSSATVAGLSAVVHEASSTINREFNETNAKPDDRDPDLLPFIAGTAWPAARMLAEYFIWRIRHDSSSSSSPRSLLRHKSRRLRFLELGAGTGFTSIFIGKALLESAGFASECAGADIYVTDLEIAMPLIELNIRENFGSQIPVALHAVPLDWTDGDKVDEFLGSFGDDFDFAADNKFKFDVIYGADVVYFPHLFAPLIDTLVRVTDTQKDQTDVILGCRIREVSKEGEFYARLGKHFFLEGIEESEWDDGVFYREYGWEYAMVRLVRRKKALDAERSDEFESMRMAWTMMASGDA